MVVGLGGFGISCWALYHAVGMLAVWVVQHLKQGVLHLQPTELLVLPQLLHLAKGLEFDLPAP